MTMEIRWIDQAALLGAALAAFIALTVSAGHWTMLSTALGLTLALVLVAYVHVPIGGIRVKLLRLLAVSAVGGLDICLTLAYPLQEWLVRPRVAADCKSLSSLPTEVAACVGSASAPGLTLLWLLGGAVVFGFLTFGLPTLATTATGKRIFRELAGLKPKA
jgi:hypothetical protein